MKPIRHIQIHHVPLADLTPEPTNEKDHTDPKHRSALRNSLQMYGQVEPLIVRPDGTVIGGHGRIEMMRELGWENVDVTYFEGTDAEVTALRIALNRTAELSGWNPHALKASLASLQDVGFDIEKIGFTVPDFAALDSGVVDVVEDDDDEVEVDHSNPDSVRGEVYELGPHFVMCGDCREHEDVLKLMGGRKINVAFTSPPYASQRTYDESSGFKPIPPDGFSDWFEAVQANVRSSLAPDGSWFVNIKEHCDDGQRSLYVKDLTIAHVRKWGWMFVDEFCWTRSGVPGKYPNRFKNGWEPVFHFSANPKIKLRGDNVKVDSESAFVYSRAHTTSPTGSGLLGSHSNELRAGLALPGNVIAVATGGGVLTGEHSAEFPVGLPDWFIRAFSDEGDNIFDPFMGSGTTMIAAAQNKRRAFGMELSPGYCDLIRRRWTKWALKAGVDPGRGALS